MLKSLVVCVISVLWLSINTAHELRISVKWFIDNRVTCNECKNKTKKIVKNNLNMVMPKLVQKLVVF